MRVNDCLGSMKNVVRSSYHSMFPFDLSNTNGLNDHAIRLPSAVKREGKSCLCCCDQHDSRLLRTPVRGGFETKVMCTQRGSTVCAGSRLSSLRYYSLEQQENCHVADRTGMASLGYLRRWMWQLQRLPRGIVSRLLFPTEICGQ